MTPTRAAALTLAALTLTACSTSDPNADIGPDPNQTTTEPTLAADVTTTTITTNDGTELTIDPTAPTYTLPQLVAALPTCTGWTNESGPTNPHGGGQCDDGTGIWAFPTPEELAGYLATASALASLTGDTYLIDPAGHWLISSPNPTTITTAQHALGGTITTP